MSNRIYPHPIIAREGWPILAGALIAVIVSWMLDLGIITFLFFVFLVFAFQFFRDPAREAPEDPRAVVSPVDGRVCKVEKCTNPETGEGFHLHECLQRAQPEVSGCGCGRESDLYARSFREC